jgi:hypothetical protein
VNSSEVPPAQTRESCPGVRTYLGRKILCLLACSCVLVEKRKERVIVYSLIVRMAVKTPCPDPETTPTLTLHSINSYTYALTNFQECNSTSDTNACGWSGIHRYLTVGSRCGGIAPIMQAKVSDAEQAPKEPLTHGSQEMPALSTVRKADCTLHAGSPQ